MKLYPKLDVQWDDRYICLSDTDKYLRIVYIQSENNIIDITDSPDVKIKALDSNIVITKKSLGFLMLPQFEGTTSIQIVYQDLSIKKEIVVYDSFFKDHYLQHFIPEYDAINLQTNMAAKAIFDTLFEFLDILYAYQNDLKDLKDPLKTKSKFLSTLAVSLGLPRDDLSFDDTFNEFTTTTVFRELLDTIQDILEVRGTKMIYELLFSVLGYDVELLEFWFDDSENLIEINPITELLSTFYKYDITGNQLNTTVNDDPRKDVSANNLQVINNKSYFIKPVIKPKNSEEVILNSSQQYTVIKYLDFLKPFHLEYLTGIISGNISNETLKLNFIDELNVKQSGGIQPTDIHCKTYPNPARLNVVPNHPVIITNEVSGNMTITLVIKNTVIQLRSIKVISSSNTTHQVITFTRSNINITLNTVSVPVTGIITMRLPRLNVNILLNLADGLGDEVGENTQQIYGKCRNARINIFSLRPYIYTEFINEGEACRPGITVDPKFGTLIPPDPGSAGCIGVIGPGIPYYGDRPTWTSFVFTRACGNVEALYKVDEKFQVAAPIFAEDIIQSNLKFDTGWYFDEGAVFIKENITEWNDPQPWRPLTSEEVIQKIAYNDREGLFTQQEWNQIKLDYANHTSNAIPKETMEYLLHLEHLASLPRRKFDTFAFFEDEFKILDLVKFKQRFKYYQNIYQNDYTNIFNQISQETDFMNITKSEYYRLIQDLI